MALSAMVISRGRKIMQLTATISMQWQDRCTEAWRLGLSCHSPPTCFPFHNHKTKFPGCQVVKPFSFTRTYTRWNDIFRVEWHCNYWMWTLVKDCPPFDIIQNRFRLFSTCNAVSQSSWLGILVSAISCHFLVFSSDSEHQTQGACP